MSLRIGILGGMFDPIHIGHCILAEHCLDQAALHTCLLIPAYQTPLRTEGGYATPYQRWMMTRIVTRTNSRLRALDLEIKRNGVSYTMATIETLQAKRPHDQLHLIIGADQLVQFTRWYRWEDIIERVTLLVAPRNDIDLDAAQHQLESAGARIQRIRMPSLDVSSSMIRQYCASGRSIRYLVHDHVYRYIRRHHLYRTEHAR